MDLHRLRVVGFDTSVSAKEGEKKYIAEAEEYEQGLWNISTDANNNKAGGDDDDERCLDNNTSPAELSRKYLGARISPPGTSRKYLDDTSCPLKSSIKISPHDKVCPGTSKKHQKESSTSPPRTSKYRFTRSKSRSEIFQIPPKKRTGKRDLKVNSSESGLIKLFQNSAYSNQKKRTLNLRSRNTRAHHKEENLKENNEDAHFLSARKTPSFTRYYRKHADNERTQKKNKRDSKLPNDMYGFQKRNRSMDQHLYQMSTFNFIDTDKLPFKKLKLGFQRKPKPPQPVTNCYCKHHAMRVLDSTNRNISGPSIYYNLGTHPYPRRPDEVSCMGDREEELVEDSRGMTKDETVEVLPSSFSAAEKNFRDAGTDPSIARLSAGSLRRPSFVHEDRRNLQNGAVTSECDQTSILLSSIPNGVAATAAPSPKNSKNTNKIFVIVANVGKGMISRLAKHITAFHVKKKMSGKCYIKYVFLGLLIVAWSPCLLAVFLAWVVMFPFKLTSILRTDTSKRSFPKNYSFMNRFRKNDPRREYQRMCFENYLPRKKTSFMTSLASWYSRTFGIVFNSFNAVISLLKLKKKPSIVAGSSFLPASHPNPRKMYTLFFADNRGWVMKPIRRKNTRSCPSTRVLQNMRFEYRPAFWRKSRTLKRSPCATCPMHSVKSYPRQKSPAGDARALRYTDKWSDCSCWNKYSQGSSMLKPLKSYQNRRLQVNISPSVFYPASSIASTSADDTVRDIAKDHLGDRKNGTLPLRVISNYPCGIKQPLKMNLETLRAHTLGLAGKTINVSRKYTPSLVVKGLRGQFPKCWGMHDAGYAVNESPDVDRFTSSTHITNSMLTKYISRCKLNGIRGQTTKHEIPLDFSPGRNHNLAIRRNRKSHTLQNNHCFRNKSFSTTVSQSALTKQTNTSTNNINYPHKIQNSSKNLAYQKVINKPNKPEQTKPDRYSKCVKHHPPKQAYKNKTVVSTQKKYPSPATMNESLKPEVALNYSFRKKQKQSYVFKPVKSPVGTQNQSNRADVTTMTNRDKPLKYHSGKKQKQFRQAYKYKSDQIPVTNEKQPVTADILAGALRDIALNGPCRGNHKQCQQGCKQKAHHIPVATQMLSRTADNTTMTNRDKAFNSPCRKKLEQSKQGHKYQPHQMPFASQKQMDTFDNTTMTSRDLALNIHEQSKHGHKQTPHQIPVATQMQPCTADITTMASPDIPLKYASGQMHEQSKQAYTYKLDQISVATQKQPCTADITSMTDRNTALYHASGQEPEKSKQAYTYEPDHISVATQEQPCTADITSMTDRNTALNYASGQEPEQPKQASTYKPDHISVATQKQPCTADNTTMSSLDIALNIDEQCKHGYKLKTHRIPIATQMQSRTADNTTMTNRDKALNSPCGEKYKQSKQAYIYPPHQIPFASQKQLSTVDNTTMTSIGIALDIDEQSKHGYKQKPHKIPVATQMQMCAADITTKDSRDIALKYASGQKHEQSIQASTYKPDHISVATQKQPCTADITSMSRRDIALKDPSEEKHEPSEQAYRYKPDNTTILIQKQPSSADIKTNTNRETALKYICGAKPSTGNNEIQCIPSTTDKDTLSNQKVSAPDCVSEKQDISTQKQDFKIDASVNCASDYERSRTKFSKYPSNQQAFAVDCGMDAERNINTYLSESFSTSRTILTLNGPTKQYFRQKPSLAGRTSEYRHVPTTQPLSARQLQMEELINQFQPHANNPLFGLASDYRYGLPPQITQVLPSLQVNSPQFKKAIDCDCSVTPQQNNPDQEMEQNAPDSKKNTYNRKTISAKQPPSQQPKLTQAPSHTLQEQHNLLNIAPDCTCGTDKSIVDTKSLNKDHPIQQPNVSKHSRQYGSHTTPLTNTQGLTSDLVAAHPRKTRIVIETTPTKSPEYLPSNRSQANSPLFGIATDCRCGVTSQIAEVPNPQVNKTTSGTNGQPKLSQHLSSAQPDISKVPKTLSTFPKSPEYLPSKRSQANSPLFGVAKDCRCGVTSQSDQVPKSQVIKTTSGINGQPKFSQHLPSTKPDVSKVPKTLSTFPKSPEYLPSKRSQANSPLFGVAKDCRCGVTSQSDQVPKSQVIKTTSGTNGQPKFSQHLPSTKPDVSKVPKTLSTFPKSPEYLPSKRSQANSPLFGVAKDCRCGVTSQSDQVPKSQVIKTTSGTNGQPKFSQHLPSTKPDVSKVPKTLSTFPKSPEYLPSKRSQANSPLFGVAKDCRCGVTPQIDQVPNSQVNKTTTGTNVQPDFSQHLPSAQPDTSKVLKILSKFRKSPEYLPSKRSQANSPLFGIATDCRCGVTPQIDQVPNSQVNKTTTGTNVQPDFSQHLSSGPDNPKEDKTMSKFPKTPEYLPSKRSQASSPLFKIASECRCGVTSQQNEPDNETKQIDAYSKKTFTHKNSPAKKSNLTQAPSRALQEQSTSLGIASDCTCETNQKNKSPKSSPPPESSAHECQCPVESMQDLVGKQPYGTKLSTIFSRKKNNVKVDKTQSKFPKSPEHSAPQKSLPHKCRCLAESLQDPVRATNYGTKVSTTSSSRKGVNKTRSKFLKSPERLPHPESLTGKCRCPVESMQDPIAKQPYGTKVSTASSRRKNVVKVDKTRSKWRKTLEEHAPPQEDLPEKCRCLVGSLQDPVRTSPYQDRTRSKYSKLPEHSLPPQSLPHKCRCPVESLQDSVRTPPYGAKVSTTYSRRKNIIKVDKTRPQLPKLLEHARPQGKLPQKCRCLVENLQGTQRKPPLQDKSRSKFPKSPKHSPSPQSLPRKCSCPVQIQEFTPHKCRCPVESLQDSVRTPPYSGKVSTTYSKRKTVVKVDRNRSRLPKLLEHAPPQGKLPQKCRCLVESLQDSVRTPPYGAKVSTTYSRTKMTVQVDKTRSQLQKLLEHAPSQEQLPQKCRCLVESLQDTQCTPPHPDTTRSKFPKSPELSPPPQSLLCNCSCLLDSQECLPGKCRCPVESLQDSVRTPSYGSKVSITFCKKNIVKEATTRPKFSKSSEYSPPRECLPDKCLCPVEGVKDHVSKNSLQQSWKSAFSRKSKRNCFDFPHDCSCVQNDHDEIPDVQLTPNTTGQTSIRSCMRTIGTCSDNEPSSQLQYSSRLSQYSSKVSSLVMSLRTKLFSRKISKQTKIPENPTKSPRAVTFSCLQVNAKTEYKSHTSLLRHGQQTKASGRSIFSPCLINMSCRSPIDDTEKSSYHTCKSVLDDESKRQKIHTSKTSQAPFLPIHSGHRMLHSSCSCLFHKSSSKQCSKTKRIRKPLFAEKSNLCPRSVSENSQSPTFLSHSSKVECCYTDISSVRLSKISRYSYSRLSRRMKGQQSKSPIECKCSSDENVSTPKDRKSRQTLKTLFRRKSEHLPSQRNTSQSSAHFNRYKETPSAQNIFENNQQQSEQHDSHRVSEKQPILTQNLSPSHLIIPGICRCAAKYSDETKIRQPISRTQQQSSKKFEPQYSSSVNNNQPTPMVEQTMPSQHPPSPDPLKSKRSSLFNLSQSKPLIEKIRSITDKISISSRQNKQRETSSTIGAQTVPVIPGKCSCWPEKLSKKISQRSQKSIEKITTFEPPPHLYSSERTQPFKSHSQTRDGTESLAEDPQLPKAEQVIPIISGKCICAGEQRTHSPNSQSLPNNQRFISPTASHPSRKTILGDNGQPEFSQHLPSAQPGEIDLLHRNSQSKRLTDKVEKHFDSISQQHDLGQTIPIISGTCKCAGDNKNPPSIQPTHSPNSHTLPNDNQRFQSPTALHPSRKTALGANRQPQFSQHHSSAQPAKKDSLHRNSQPKRLTEKVQNHFDLISQQHELGQTIPIISGTCKCAGDNKNPPSIQPTHSPNSHTLPNDNQRLQSPTALHPSRKTALGADRQPQFSQHHSSAQPAKIDSHHRNSQSKRLTEKVEKHFNSISQQPVDHKIPIITGSCRCAGEQNKKPSIQPINSHKSQGLPSDNNQRFKSPTASHPSRKTALRADVQPKIRKQPPNQPLKTPRSKLSQPHSSQEAEILYSVHNSQLTRNKKPSKYYSVKIAKTHSPGMSHRSIVKFQKPLLILRVCTDSAKPKRFRQHIMEHRTEISQIPQIQPNPQIQIYHVQQNLQNQKQLSQIPTNINKPPPGLSQIPTNINKPPPGLSQIPTNIDQPPAGLPQIPTSLDKPPPGMLQIPTSLNKPPPGLLQQYSPGHGRQGTAKEQAQLYPDFNRVSMRYPGHNTPHKQTGRNIGLIRRPPTNKYPPAAGATPPPNYTRDPCYTILGSKCARQPRYDESALRSAYKRRPLRYTPPNKQLPRVLMEKKLRAAKKRKLRKKKSVKLNFIRCMRQSIKKTEQEAWPSKFNCRPMYINTLKRRPCFWIFKLWPRIYPTVLNIDKYQRYVGHALVYFFTFCFWSPLLICGYICYNVCQCCA